MQITSNPIYPFLYQYLCLYNEKQAYLQNRQHSITYMCFILDVGKTKGFILGIAKTKAFILSIPKTKGFSEKRKLSL